MSRRERILELNGQSPQILPSILNCDFGDLKHEINQLLDTDVSALHLDVMDGQMVPNLSFGIPVVAGLRRHVDVPLDVHLMINTPDKYVEAFFEAGADAITIHGEAVMESESTVETLDRIRELGAAAGIAINPQTPLESIEECVGHCDLVLIMSVNAGFGGQSFQPVALEKLKSARSMFGPDVILEVDGGVNRETIAGCAAYGAEFLVVGSAITRSDDYAASVSELNNLMTGAPPDPVEPAS